MGKYSLLVDDMLNQIVFNSGTKFVLETGILEARRLFRRTSSFVPEAAKWIKYTVCTGRILLFQLPGNTRSSETVINLNFIWPLKSPDFGAFKPFGLIGKLCSPAIIGPKHGFCSGKITPLERC